MLNIKKRSSRSTAVSGFLALGLCFILSACLDLTGPRELDEGIYALTMVNGQRLPATMLDDKFETVRITGGALIISGSGTIVYSLSGSSFDKETGELEVGQAEERGSYVLADSQRTDNCTEVSREVLGISVGVVQNCQLLSTSFDNGAYKIDMLLTRRREVRTIVFTEVGDAPGETATFTFVKIDIRPSDYSYMGVRG